MANEQADRGLQPKRTVAELKELRALTGDADGAQRVAFTDTWAEARAWWEALARQYRGEGVEFEPALPPPGALSSFESVVRSSMSCSRRRALRSISPSASRCFGNRGPIAPSCRSSV